MSDDGLSYPVGEGSLVPVVRALAMCFGSLERLSTQWIEAAGLTPSQFDVLVTLGDLPTGLNCKEIAQRSLVSSPTLTPVMARLEAKGLITKRKSPEDARHTIVALTPAGQAHYEAIFLPHIRRMRAVLAPLDAQEQGQLEALLLKMKGALDAAQDPNAPAPSPCALVAKAQAEGCPEAAAACAETAEACAEAARGEAAEA